ncbi:ABC transporter G family member 20-like [Chironomus tepperi]|uniref:ABC transporter G family member 20-like n=1 Tax=Chironomus tepperi TaxID=113505 RepID=UPI00391F9257
MDAETDGLPPMQSETNSHVIDVKPRRKILKTQQSTVATRRQQAVCVRRAHKIYGTKKNPNVILDGLNMTVPKGTIYGLLGASGCGKTTLLSCIVGRRRLNSGEIWVLGGRPGSRGSGVPGPRIGYMPQEIALYGEFTIRETLIYFGWINGLTKDDVDEKTDFLLKMLQLPNASRFVKNLSGGQQRRMSLAAALIHEPELLILDEPTVGVDPVLRQTIWDYLVDITRFGRTTVIITTHYIDETRQAHKIGLMRGGKFLAEESPDDLLQKYHCESLEEVFLKLSVIQNRGKRRRSSIAKEVIDSIQLPGIANPALDLTHDEDHGEISGEFGDNISMSSRGPDMVTAPPHAPPLPPEEEPEATCMDHMKIFKMHHMKALVWKNFLWMWRNFGVMAFIIGLPVAQTILFCLAVGHDPEGLPLAVVNNEMSDKHLAQQECPIYEGCNYTMLSCRYLDFLRNRSIEVKFYGNDEEAIEVVRHGKAWGTISFAHNYTDSLVERTDFGHNVESYIIDGADVNVHLDMSNQQIGTLLYRDIQYAYFDFIESILKDCQLNPLIGKIPIFFDNPIYGDRIPNFTDFAAPGVQLTIIFFLSVALTSGAMLIERNEGMLERCLVSGVTGIEILFSHVITQFCVMSFQTALVLTFSFSVFDLTNRGEMFWVIMLVLETGFCGMCFGFVISCAVDNERSATYMALGSFLPCVLLCGMIWPIEGMHPFLRVPALFLPLTKSTESLRAIMQRGWSIENPDVYIGYVSTGIWILIFLTISILLLKFKKG